MSAPELEVRPPGAPPFRIPLDPLPFRIGRSPESNLVLRDNRASRSHAAIAKVGEDYLIEDAGSRNGIEVNGVRVQRKVLHESDVIRFGVDDSYELVFHLSPGVPPSQTQAHHGGLRRLRSMLEVARSLQGALSIDQVLNSVVEAALAITSCERGFLLLAEGQELTIRVARDAAGRQLAENDLDVPRQTLSRALRNRSELLSMRFNPEAPPGSPGRLESSVQHLALRTIVCVPLVKVRAGELAETAVVGTIADTIGLLYLDSRQDQAELTMTSRDLVRSLAVEASFVLENARLLEEERKKQHMEQELDIAQAIQRDLLPDTGEYPSMGWLQAAGVSIPSRHVGGDYFDLLPIGDDRYEVVMADVSGKGVSSALLASLLQGAFVMSTAEVIPPSVFFDRLNRFLLARTAGEKYATVFLASLHRAGPMQWANAGHCAPLLVRRNGQMFQLTATGTPVGMLEEAKYIDASATLGPGDLLVLYTDGVTEAHAPDGTMFGLERLAAALQERVTATPKEITDHLHRAIRAFMGSEPARDDMTLLVLRFAGG